MTLENLIKIVAEAVLKVLLMEKMNIVCIAFDEKNEPRVKEAAESINQNAKWFYPKLGCDGLVATDPLPDVLFLDFIPMKFISEMALGQRSCPLMALVSNMLLAGKKIVVLGYAPTDFENSPQPYKALFTNYYQMIESYGVIFPSNTQKAEPQVYNGNVLSKKELLAYATAGEIKITDTCIVTNLATEEADKRNIKIIKG